MRPPLAAEQTLRTDAQAEGILQWLGSEAEPIETRAEWLQAFSGRQPGADELIWLLRVLQRKMVSLDLRTPRLSGPLLDVCGTGGDGADLFNISTAVAFVCAGAGAAVAKHGNRAITSASGTADVLEVLGVPLVQDPEAAAAAIEQRRFAFLFAPAFHPAFKAIGPVRRHLALEGVPTIFNLFGPLLNPARPRRQLIGVNRLEHARVVAELCAQMDYLSVLVVNGAIEETGGRMDEVSLCGVTEGYAIRDGAISDWSFDARDHGFARVAIETLRGRGPEGNARLIETILAGEIAGPAMEMVVLNSAVGLMAAGIADSVVEGVERARTSILSGSALAVLDGARRPA